MAVARLKPQASTVAKPVIERDEIVALLFNVSDIARSAEVIVRLLKEDDDGEEETDEG
jgi:hypothetical protein